jgi:hypothetical protein
MFYVSRWYDPSLGRFVQADALIPESTQGTQAWDRYAYVNNNPVRYNDPTGHKIKEDEDKKDDELEEVVQQKKSIGGDENVGYEIDYTYGIVILHYYGQYTQILLDDAMKDAKIWQALLDFESNTDARVAALDDLKEAQIGLVTSTGEALFGGILFAAGVVGTIASEGTLGPVTAPTVIGGFSLMVMGGVNVYNSAMQWGTAAEAYGNAEDNLLATWSLLNVQP